MQTEVIHLVGDYALYSAGYETHLVYSLWRRKAKATAQGQLSYIQESKATESKKSEASVAYIHQSCLRPLCPSFP